VYLTTSSPKPFPGGTAEVKINKAIIKKVNREIKELVFNTGSEFDRLSASFIPLLMKKIHT
jgi:hypothetical protein